MEDLKKIEQVIARVGNLPTLPVVVTRLTALLDNPDTNIKEVTQTLSEDQVLTAKILKLSNSTFYGFPGEISTIRQAVVVLGFAAVRDIALSASLFDVFPTQENDHNAFNIFEFWEHTLGVAIMSKQLAEFCLYNNPEEAFVAGLLHDIGKLVMLQYLPNDFAKVMTEVTNKDITYLEAEKVLEISHAGLGRYLADKWNLPLSISEPVGFHHSLRLNRDSAQIMAIVHVADILVRAKGVGSSGDKRIPAINSDAWNLLNLSMDALPELMQKFDNGILHAGVFMEMIKGK